MSILAMVPIISSTLLSMFIVLMIFTEYLDFMLGTPSLITSIHVTINSTIYI